MQQLPIDRERSSAVAQDALTWLTKLSLPPSPDNFEIAYSYLGGGDPELTRAVESLLSAGTPTATEFADLRDRFFRHSRNQDSMLAVGTQMAAELNGVLKVLEAAGRDQTAFGKTLSKASGELGGGNLSANSLKAMVDQVVAATRSMEARSIALEQRLRTSSREINDLHQRLESVKRESLTDQLTGIANRKAFDIEFKASMQQSIDSGEPLSLVMCDIDHFKRFNDTWGHQAGDQVLRLVSNCLAENVKGRDTAARYGGEEFALILPQTPLSGAVRLANQIRQNVESKKLIKKSTGDTLGTITISMGAVQFAPGESPEEFIYRADSCLYAAKRTGRNRVVSETDRTALAAAEQAA